MKENDEKYNSHLSTPSGGIKKKNNDEWKATLPKGMDP